MGPTWAHVSHEDTGDGNHFHCLVWPLTTSEHTNRLPINPIHRDIYADL